MLRRRSAWAGLDEGCGNLIYPQQSIAGGCCDITAHAGSTECDPFTCDRSSAIRRRDVDSRDLPEKGKRFHAVRLQATPPACSWPAASSACEQRRCITHHVSAFPPSGRQMSHSRPAGAKSRRTVPPNSCVRPRSSSREPKPRRSGRRTGGPPRSRQAVSTRGTASADCLKDQLRSTQPSETESAPYSAALVASSSKARLSVTTAFGRHHQPARPGTRAVLAQVPTLVLGAVLPLGPAHLEPRDDGAAILR